MPSGRRPLSFLSLARAGIFRHPADRLHTGWESFGQTPSHPCVGQRRQPRSRPRRIPGPRRCRRGSPPGPAPRRRGLPPGASNMPWSSPKGRTQSLSEGRELRLVSGFLAAQEPMKQTLAPERAFAAIRAAAAPRAVRGCFRPSGRSGWGRPPRIPPLAGTDSVLPVPPRGFPGRWKGGDRLATGPALPKENADFRPGCEERHPAAGRRLVSSRPEDSIPGKPEISLENLQTIFKGKGRFSGFFQPDVAGFNRERMRASPPEIPERELTFPAISVTIKN